MVEARANATAAAMCATVSLHFRQESEVVAVTADSDGRYATATGALLADRQQPGGTLRLLATG